MKVPAGTTVGRTEVPLEGPSCAADVMTVADEDLHDVIDRMGAEGLQRILVADDAGRLRGIITLSDLARRTDLPERIQDTLDQISRHRA